MLEAQIKKISTNQVLHVICVSEINVELKNLLDSFFVSICEGESETELSLVKQRLADFLGTKEDKTKMGAVAEFMVHLYLNKMNYKQEFLFFNLEENSIKKGFDGLFSKDKETYLVESKSGSISIDNINHEVKLKAAYSDLKNYVSGKSKKGSNNPWKNAFNHASHCDVGTEKSIRKKIRLLRDKYDSGEYTKIEEYNIVPCSTIYLNSDWSDAESEKIISDNNFIKGFSGLSVNAICITKSSLDDFINYLGE